MPHNGRQLVRRCLAGDRNAFGALHVAHAGRVFHLLRRLTGSAVEAEDLTQETFLAAYRTLASWRGKGAFGTWLCGIAYRQFANANRRRRPTAALEEAHEIPEMDTDPLVLYTQLESEENLERAIQALPTLSREVFVLVKVEGLSYREAADCLEVPVGTVQSRLWRAVCQLRAALTEAEEGRRAGMDLQKGEEDAMRKRA